MKQPKRQSLFLSRVTFLTLLLMQAGCAYIQNRYGETCKTRAYVQTDIESYVKSRYLPESPVRVAVIPFTTPANVSAKNLQFPGLGDILAWGIHAELVRSQALPIVEVLNRQDWPGKKEEFFTGNYGAITQSRYAGYDLALVGYMEMPHERETYHVYTKLIEVESGITVWYGQTTVHTRRGTMDRASQFLGMTARREDMYYTKPITEDASKCIVRAMLKDPEFE